jgi:DNA-binding transcriptional ArsR family regulator
LSSVDAAADPLSLALAAAAHPIRRDILERIAREPLTVGAVSTAYPVSLPAISRHLKTLERAGLIERRIDGRNHVIALRSAGLRQIAEWSATQSAEWAERLAKLKSLMEEDNG